nr:hypothetical protein [candidate division Zixibacteria bacterium]
MSAFNRYVLMAVLFSLMVISISCSPDDPDKTTYFDEMRSFIEESVDGRELYTINLYPEDSYYADDTLRVMVHIDSTIRYYDCDIDTIPRDIGGFDQILNAVIEIHDFFYGRVDTIGNSDTAFYHYMESWVTRRAYFLKLYDDNYEYHGWRFWGYSCVTTAAAAVGEFKSSGGEAFSTLPPDTMYIMYIPHIKFWKYFNKNNVVIISPKDSIVFTTDQSLNVFPLVGGKVIGSFRTVLSGDKYTTGWRLPSSSEAFFNLFIVDGSWVLDNDSTLVKKVDQAIPFKINNSK